MLYRVFKSSFDGICGCESFYESIEKVLKEISYSKGWDSLEQLHIAIRKWASKARLGDVFKTQVTVIVAIGFGNLGCEDDVCRHCGHVGLQYSDIDSEESQLVQEVDCPECGRTWQDIYLLAERKEL
ncbi:MAG: hypothetical protein KGL39_00310 [Patescibacteria group bacterium]|nr:hypothetical protein [Patescibacteria group bacterium]